MTTRQLIQFNRRGQSLVVMALFLVVLMGMAALAIDLGMLQKARADAQRAADGAALAGASAYLEKTFDQAVAIRRADSIATANDMAGAAIVSSEVTVEFPAANQVRVRVRRDAMPLWFGRVFGINTLPVGAWATAEAAAAGTAKCLKPFALPDLWHESDVSEDPLLTGVNDFWDLNESWTFGDDTDDCYTRTGGQPGLGASCGYDTGYGSTLRNGDGTSEDLGRVIKIKPRQPGQTITSAWFYPVRIGDNSGGSDYKNGIACSCGPADPTTGVPPATLCPSINKAGEPIVTVLDSVYKNFTETGNMVGPTKDGVGSLVCQDPGATWATDQVSGSNWGTAWRDSPRVITIGLFDPYYVQDIHSGGGLDFGLNNFATLFLEGFQEDDGTWCPINCSNKNNPVSGGCTGALVARFVGFAKGFSQGPGEEGSLVKYLRLIK